MYKKRKNTRQVRKWWLVVLVLSINLLWSRNLAQPVHAQESSVTPKRIEVTLEAGNCSNETVTVTLSTPAIPKLDLAFVIDVTGSMKEEISEVTNSAGQIVADVRGLIPDTAFALGTVADYDILGYGKLGDYPWRLDQDITLDQSKIQVALNNIDLKHGGGKQESYLRALYETQFISWRDGSRRIVILFGDSLPRAPDPGRDAELGTSDDLTQAKVLSQLADNEMAVIGVYTMPDNEHFYQAVANQTGGHAFYWKNTTRITEIMQQLVSESVNSIQALRLVPSSPGDEWLEWEPEVQRDVRAAERRHFAVTLCVPPETTPSDYTFDITVTADGANIGQIPVLVHVVGADLAVEQEGVPNPALVGEEVSYILTVTNHGTLPATEVMLTDELPQGAEFVSATSTQGNCTEAGGSLSCELLALPKGASATVTLVVKPTQALKTLNSVTVTGKEGDPDPSNNSSEENLTVNPVSEISIAHTPVDSVTTGDVLTYTLTMTNHGPSPASGVIFTDRLPAKTTFNSATASQGSCNESGGTVSCQLGQMALNAQVSVELLIVPEEHGTMTNQGTVEADEFDPDLSNNNAEESTTVNRRIPWWLLVPFLLLLPLLGWLLAWFRRRRNSGKAPSSVPRVSAPKRPPIYPPPKPEKRTDDGAKGAVTHDKREPPEKRP